MANILSAKITRYLEGLRFPTLAGLTAGLFVLDLLIPDVVPFVDEILLAMLLAVLARLKKRKE